jgi:hypothetical protein
MDVNRVIGEVAVRHGIRVEVDDPAFAVATICELLLEEKAEALSENVQQRLEEFREAAQALETRAGKLVAMEVKAAAEGIRQELRKEAEHTRLRAVDLMEQIHRAHSRAALLRWGAIGALTCAGALAIGVWIGANFVH